MCKHRETEKKWLSDFGWNLIRSRRKQVWMQIRLRESVACTIKLVQHTQGIFPLSGFTYTNIGNQEMQLNEAHHNLANLTQGFSLCSIGTIWPVTIMDKRTGSRAELILHRKLELYCGKI